MLSKFTMKTSLFRIFIIALSGSILFFTSCTPQSCFEETEAFLKATFYQNETLRAPDSLTVYGISMDSTKIYNKSGNIKLALIPFNASSDNSVFVIKINDITDTITFFYSSYPHLVSKECGYTFYHTLLDQPVYTTNVIDTVYIRKNNITILNEENIRIFY